VTEDRIANVQAEIAALGTPGSFVRKPSAMIEA
jgi:hypothetical protein